MSGDGEAGQRSPLFSRATLHVKGVSGFIAALTGLLIAAGALVAAVVALFGGNSSPPAPASATLPPCAQDRPPAPGARPSRNPPAGRYPRRVCREV